MNLADASLERMTQRLGWVHERAGERFSQIEIGTLLFDFCITDDREQYAREAVERLASWYQGTPTTVDDYLASVSVLIGTVDEMVERLLLWREQLGISYVVVWPQHHAEAFAPVVTRLAGR